MLRGKKILLAVTGSIAAYKSAYLVRLLITKGCKVKVVLSPSARDFITPLTLSTLSKNPVYWEYFNKEDETGQWHNHVQLALWADAMIIAPATANTLAKMARAQADNFLMAVYLSAKCPVYFSPAMDLDMHRHPGTQANIRTLKEYGHHHIPAESGELASGLQGEGRMAEPEHIIALVEQQMRANMPLMDKKILISAGPTHEPLDPVRYLGNRSSGKMGIAIADAAAQWGAEVQLILGPTALLPQHDSVHVTRVQTAQEMLKACEEHFPHSDVAIMAAAVADYRPEKIAEQKIKKDAERYELPLVKNQDILLTLGRQKKEHQRIIGFALETENEVTNALKKLHKKNCDYIVLNTPTENTGFGKNTNAVQLLNSKGKSQSVPLNSKEKIAYEILEHTICHPF